MRLLMCPVFSISFRSFNDCTYHDIGWFLCVPKHWTLTVSEGKTLVILTQRGKMVQCLWKLTTQPFDFILCVYYAFIHSETQNRTSMGMSTHRHTHSREEINCSHNFWCAVSYMSLLLYSISLTRFTIYFTRLLFAVLAHTCFESAHLMFTVRCALCSVHIHHTGQDFLVWIKFFLFCEIDLNVAC